MGMNKSFLFFCIPLLVFSQKNVNLTHTHKYSSKEDVDSTYFSSFFKTKKTSSKKHKIAVLLPFCNNKNELIFDLNMDSLLLLNSLDRVDFYKKSKISIDFFLGFLLSINEFTDVNLEISVYDIKDGPESRLVLENILNEKKIHNYDFVIGPLFTDNFLFFSQQFDDKIPIINPFSKKEYITNSCNNVFQLQSNVLKQLSVFSDYIFSQHINDNILLVRRDTMFEYKTSISDLNDTLNLIDTIIPTDIHYANSFLESVDTNSITFHEIKVANNVIDSIHHKLDTLGMKNVIIISSNDNVFVTDLLSKLHAARDTGMVVYGLPNLFDFEYIPIVDLMDMHVTFPYNKLDTNNVVDNFKIKFYNEYNYLPAIKYAAVGYEIGLYFLNILFEYDEILPHVLNQEPKIFLETLYSFEKQLNGGYKNKGFVILRYNDFGYIRVD